MGTWFACSAERFFVCCRMKGLVRKLVVCGCGSSSCTPMLRCLLSSNPCEQCLEASKNPLSKNRRNNTSLLLQAECEHQQKNILIDCGKTFRHAVSRFLVEHNVSTIDSIVLTHHHSDAILGLDDIREVSRGPVNLHCDESTSSVVSHVFPYLLPDSSAQKTRWVAALNVHTFSALQPFFVEGVEMLPIRVHHGDCCANGFVFNASFGRVAYISDAAMLSDDNYNAILRGGMIHTLFLDCLRDTTLRNPSHLNSTDALDVAQRIAATRTFFTGLGHSIDYEKFARRINKINSSFMCAYDGLTLT